MSAFWHPLSALYLDEPRVLASPAVLRMMLAGEGRAVVRYAGDRMWPTLRHGQALEIVPLAGRSPEDGEVVLTVDEGYPDLLRVLRAKGTLELVADAGSDGGRRVAEKDLLGPADLDLRRPGARPWARIRLDLVEAWVGRPESGADPATSVREKYDAQSIHYARGAEPDLEPSLGARIAASVRAGGRILVAGSGVGREALALATMGYDVVGIDFSTRMIEASRAAALARKLEAVFTVGDLREHEEPAGSLDAVVFTYDVYSFIPTLEARRGTLKRLRRSLRGDGRLFLSARRRSSLADRAILTLQWGAGRLTGRPIAWGDSHTRWLDASGRLRRSFVHVFTPRALEAELRGAGFSLEGWQGGHGLYRVAESAS